MSSVGTWSLNMVMSVSALSKLPDVILHQGLRLTVMAHETHARWKTALSTVAAILWAFTQFIFMQLSAGRP